MSDDPTPRQAEVLAFIRHQLDASGVPPTLHEIAAAFGLASANGVAKHVQALEAKGHLVVTPHKSRGIRLAVPPRGRADRLALPVLGRVAAGSPIGADAGGIDGELLLDRHCFSRTPDYLLRVQGDSMRDDGIFDGDLVAVQRAADAHDGEIVVARIDGEITIKRLKRMRTGIQLLPRNPDYAPIDVPRDADFAIEGLYCGLVRRD